MAPHRNSVLESWHSDPLSDVANAGLPRSPIVPVQPAEHYWSPSESEITPRSANACPPGNRWIELMPPTQRSSRLRSSEDYHRESDKIMLRETR